MPAENGRATYLSPEQRLELRQEIEAKLRRLHEAEKGEIATHRQREHDE